MFSCDMLIIVINELLINELLMFCISVLFRVADGCN